jgi:cytochrome c-type biogenesis protein CcmH
MADSMLRQVFSSLSLVLAALSAQAVEAPPVAANPEIEARMMAVSSELRCLVCQNQTIADSHAELAVDLRQEIRELVAAGQSDQQIRDYMTARYGDFVLYRPPFKASTMVLWLGPAVLLVLAVGTLIRVLRRRQKLGAEAFEPETDPDAETATTADPDATLPSDPQQSSRHVPNR